MEEVWNGSSSSATLCWSSSVSTARSSSSLQIGSLSIHGQIQLQLQPPDRLPPDPRPRTPRLELEEARTAGTGISLSLSLLCSLWLCFNFEYLFCLMCWVLTMWCFGEWSEWTMWSGPGLVTGQWLLLFFLFFPESDWTVTWIVNTFCYYVI